MLGLKRAPRLALSRDWCWRSARGRDRLRGDRSRRSQTFTPRSEQPDHQPRRAAAADPQLLRRSARHRASRRRQQLRQGGTSASRRRARASSRGHAKSAQDTAPIKAIVLDVDDTTLATWNYEIFSNWAYNPTTNADFVTSQRFPAVPGHGRHGEHGRREGYAIFYLTGRPATQEAATLGNLTADGIGVDAGLPAPTTLNDGEDGLFTKPAVADYPDYLKAACAGDPERLVHHGALQDGDARAHRVARLRHRRQLRRPVQRPGRAATPTRPSSCRTRTTSCRNGASHCGGASIQTSRRMTRAARPQA